MAPAWPGFGSQDDVTLAPQMVSKPTPERSRKRGRLHNRFRDDFGADFGSIWADVGLILVDSGSMFV